MIYLIMYDIEADRTRTKLADRLLELGLERIQLSVFMGMAPERTLFEVLDHFGEKIESGDKIYAMPIHASQIETMKVWGAAIPSTAYRYDNTMII